MSTLLFTSLPSAAGSTLELGLALPTYTRTTTTDTEWDVPAAEQEHYSHLTRKKTGMPWLSLSVRSRATSEGETPMFYQGGEVAGAVKMVLEKEELMDDVVLSVSVQDLLVLRAYAPVLYAYISFVRCSVRYH